jgi:hypothetical protein
MMLPDYRDLHGCWSCTYSNIQFDEPSRSLHYTCTCPGKEKTMEIMVFHCEDWKGYYGDVNANL